MRARRLRKFWRLPASEQWLLAKVALLLEAISLGMWMLPLRTLRRLLTVLVGVPGLGSRGMDRASADRVGWAVAVVSRYRPGGKTCLTQALAAQLLFARRGLPATLHIGAVKDEEGQFLAHAWMESEGQVVIGGHELERYTPLVALGEEGKWTQ